MGSGECDRNSMFLIGSGDWIMVLFNTIRSCQGGSGLEDPYEFGSDYVSL